MIPYLVFLAQSIISFYLIDIFSSDTAWYKFASTFINELKNGELIVFGYSNEN